MNIDENDMRLNIPKIVAIFNNHVPFARRVYADHISQFDEPLLFLFLPDLLREAQLEYESAMRRREFLKADQIMEQIAIAVEETLNLNSPYADNLISVGFYEALHEFHEYPKLVEKLGSKGKSACAEELS